MLEIVQIPVLQDNYTYLVVCLKTRQTAIVDPSEALPVIAELEKRNLSPQYIWNTHHHWDHVGGNEVLAQKYSELVVCCSHHDLPRIAKATLGLGEGDQLDLGEHVFGVLDIPGHTLGHIAYFHEDNLFCGDTLFGSGCGRLFEGTPGQMLRSLEKLCVLPAETKVYCGHEYTLNNLLFAKLVEPQNENLLAKLESVRMLRREKFSSVPTTLAEEKSYNPFLRCYEESVRRSVGLQCNRVLTDAESVFTALREWKNHY